MDSPYQNRRWVKRMARGVLHGLQRLLPAAAYDALYRPAFALHKRWTHDAYARCLERARARGDNVTTTRMQRVLSVMPYSLVGPAGLEHTHDLAMHAIAGQVPGAFVECGVAQGGCAALMTLVAHSDRPQRPCWFFDSFEGLPDPGQEDFENGTTGDHIRPLPRGSCLGTYEQVSWLMFDHFRFARERVHLVRGWFSDTLPETAAKIGPIAFLRVDGDWYDSTMCCFEHLYDLVAEGGFVLIDDYCSCHGARKATDRFLADRGIHAQLEPDGRGGASFRKPATSQRTSSRNSSCAA